MFKIVQNIAFTRYIKNTLNIDEEICERWTDYAKNWDVTNLDGTPLVITPELVEDNWGDRSVKVKTYYGNRSLYEILHEMAAEDFDMELWNDQYDSSVMDENDFNEEWTVERD